jgi:hypothetical protein
MSLFVHPENQKILWNIINGNPFIIRYFETKPPIEKENWFKKSIEEFYIRIHGQGKEINPQELNNLNKEFLTNMIQSVHIQNPQFTAHNSSNIQNHESTHHSINTPPVINDSKDEIFNKQFQMRQQEYDNMLKRKIPEEIDFREVSKDENKDINELLERERRERQELMKPIPKTNKLNIQESNNIKLEAVDLEVNKEKKNVSWSNELKQETIEKQFELQKSEMYSMRLHIIDLTKQLEEVVKRISSLEKENKEGKQKMNEIPMHNVSKYANLEGNEKKTETMDIKSNDQEVLIEDVNTDSDV